MNKIKKFNIPLKYLSKIPENLNEYTTLVFFLHGYGSNKEDLFSLHNYLPKDWACISLEGTIPLIYGGWSWSDLDFKNILELPKPQQMIDHRNLIIESVNVIKEELSLKSGNCILSGFSQGGSMSLLIALTKPNIFHGIASLCGMIKTDYFNQEIINNTKNKSNIFMANGTIDDRIPISMGRYSCQVMREKGLEPIYKEYNSGHTISEECLKDFISWINDIRASN